MPGEETRERTGALSLRGLTVAFDGSPEPASHGIDLDLVPGRVLALVGESGSGKSVTALGSLGLLPGSATVTGSALVRTGAGETAEEIELVGAERAVLDDVRGRLVGTIFQEPTTALDPLETIASQIGEAVRAHATGRGARRAVEARVLELLGRVGLGDEEQVARIARSYPHQLSGGQLQRAAVARMLAQHADLLVFDDVSSALDARNCHRRASMSYLRASSAYTIAAPPIRDVRDCCALRAACCSASFLRARYSAARSRQSSLE